MADDTKDPKKDEALKEEAPVKEEEAPKAEAPKEEPKKEKSEKGFVNLSKDAQKIMDLVEKLPVLELANLVKALEDKFGVTAAAPVVAAMPAGGAEAGGEEGGGAKTVILASAGGQKIAVIKVVREITGLGLKEAKDIVDGAPKEIKQGVEAAEAEEIKKKLEEAGATVELK